MQLMRQEVQLMLVCWGVGIQLMVRRLRVGNEKVAMMIWVNEKAMTAKWDGGKLHMSSHVGRTKNMELLMTLRSRRKMSTANGDAAGDILTLRAGVAPN